MANTIIIQYPKFNLTMQTKDDTVAEFPLLEDLTITYKSQFSSLSDMFPKISDIIGTINSYAALGGSAQLTGITSKLDAKKWKGTDPVRFSVVLGFHQRNLPFKFPLGDIYEGMSDIVNLTVLTALKEQLVTPGMNLRNIENFSQHAGNENSKESLSDNGKLISIEIPGIIYLPFAFIETATPTYSKEICENGFPLWGKVECNIEGLFPATSDIFYQTRKQNREL